MHKFKSQKGSALMLVLLFMAFVAFYMTVYADGESKQRKDNFHTQLRSQINSYLSALDIFGDTYCTFDGEVLETQLYPDFSAVHWSPPFNAQTAFQIDNSTGMRSIVLSFNDIKHYEYISNFNWTNMLVERNESAKELIFTHGRKIAASQGRAIYNRSLFISSTPNGC